MTISSEFILAHESGDGIVTALPHRPPCSPGSRRDPALRQISTNQDAFEHPAACASVYLWGSRVELSVGRDFPFRANAFFLNPPTVSIKRVNWLGGDHLYTAAHMLVFWPL